MSISASTANIGDALRRAVEALKRADHARAIGLAREFILAEPTHAGAFHVLGQALSGAARPRDALDALLHALALDPSRAVAHAAYGQVLLGVDAVASADAYGLATTLDPDAARFWGGLGAALAADNRHELACTAWSAAIGRNSGNWAYHYGRGQSLLRLDRIEDAIPYLAEAARLKPVRWQVQAQLGAALARINRFDEALIPLRAAAMTNPETAQVLFTLGQVLVRLDRTAEAVAPLETAVRLTPDDADKRFELGFVLFRLGRTHESLAHVDAAVKCRPDHEATHMLKALLLADLGQPGEALREWCQVIENGCAGLRRKVYFYPLSRLCAALSEQDGRAAVVSGMIKFMCALSKVTPPIALASRRPETHAFLAAIAAEFPRGAIDEGIFYLLNDRPVDALACFGGYLSGGGTIAPKYDRVITDGPDAGHPAWHLMNPFFYQWAEASIGTADGIQGLWQGEDVFSKIRSIDELNSFYEGWRRTPFPAREVLRSFLTGAECGIKRVLDLGCGFGQWLRFLKSECNISSVDLYGADFHFTRVEACRTVLNQNAGLPEEAVAPPENLFQFDALTWSPSDFLSKNGAPDLVILMAFISVFDDDQLLEVLARIAQLGAPYLFECSPIDRWDLNYGRIDPAEHFQRVGYRRIFRQLSGDPITSQRSYELMLPCKYWPAHQIGIYTRI